MVGSVAYLKCMDNSAVITMAFRMFVAVTTGVTVTIQIPRVSATNPISGWNSPAVSKSREKIIVPAAAFNYGSTESWRLITNGQRLIGREPLVKVSVSSYSRLTTLTKTLPTPISPDTSGTTI